MSHAAGVRTFEALAAELAPGGRTIAIEGGVVRTAKQASPELLAIATFALARDGGSLAVVPSGFAISFA